MTTLIICSGILGYIAVAFWMFGYINAKWANNYNLKQGYEARSASYYRDDSPLSAIISLFWPLYILFGIMWGGFLVAAHNNGEKVANSFYKKAKIRIANKTRIELEQKEIEAEVEEALEPTENSKLIHF